MMLSDSVNICRSVILNIWKYLVTLEVYVLSWEFTVLKKRIHENGPHMWMIQRERNEGIIDHGKSPVLRFSGPQSKWQYMEDSTSAVQFHFPAHSLHKVQSSWSSSFTMQTTGTFGTCWWLCFEESGTIDWKMWIIDIQDVPSKEN